MLRNALTVLSMAALLLLLLGVPSVSANSNRLGIGGVLPSSWARARFSGPHGASQAAALERTLKEDKETDVPTLRPTDEPTWRPTAEPTTSPPTMAPVTPTAAPVTPTSAPVLPIIFLTSNPTLSPVDPAQTTNEPTDPPATDRPTPRPTSRPTARPTKKPTLPPTLLPTFKPTASPTSPPTVSQTSNSPTQPPLATTNPTATTTATTTTTPTFHPSDEPTVPTTMSPTRTPGVQLDTWVRVSMKSVAQEMNALQKSAFETEAVTFLSNLFRLTIPLIDRIEVEVTGQKMLDGGRRRMLDGGWRRRDLRELLTTTMTTTTKTMRTTMATKRMGGGDGDSMASLRWLQDGAVDDKDNGSTTTTTTEEEAESTATAVTNDEQDSTTTAQSQPSSSPPAPVEVELYPLQIDLRVRGQFVPTEVHTISSDVNFDGMVRNFFTVNGGAVVSALNDLAVESAGDGGAAGVDDGLDYFESVTELRGVTPSTATDSSSSGGGGGGGSGDGDPATKGAGDGGGGGGDNSNTAYLVAIIVGSVAFVGLVAGMFILVRNKRRKNIGTKNGAGGNQNGSSSRSSSSNKRDKSSKKSTTGNKSKSKFRSNKQSGAVNTVLTNEERMSKIPPGPMHGPEDASEVASLARIHHLEAEDYSYSLEDGLGKSKSFGPLFDAGSKENPTSYSDDDDGAGGPDDEMSDLYSPVGSTDYDNHGGGGGPSTQGLRSGGMADLYNIGDYDEQQQPSNKSSSVGNGKTGGAADDLRNKSSLMDDMSLSTSGGMSPTSPMSERGGADPTSSSRKDGAPPQDGREEPPLSPEADAWLYETITDVLGPPSVAGHEDEEASSQASASQASGGMSGASPAGMRPNRVLGVDDSLDRLDMDRNKAARGAATTPDNPEDSVADDRTAVTTVTKLQSVGMEKRDCYAPPGKLGVVIDSTSKGPVVHDVKSTSPLEGIIFPGDRIIAIDDEDCRTLPASMVTKIMASKKDNRRKLTVLSVVTGINPES